MTALILGLCALACPVGMLGMMWFMRRGGHAARKDGDGS
jgi:hypothetical protein